MNDNGCGDHNCYLRRPRGQGTNGGCNCLLDVPQGLRLRIMHHLERLRRERDEALIKESWAAQAEEDLAHLRAEVARLRAELAAAGLAGRGTAVAADTPAAIMDEREKA